MGECLLYWNNLQAINMTFNLESINRPRFIQVFPIFLILFLPATDSGGQRPHDCFLRGIFLLDENKKQ